MYLIITQTFQILSLNYTAAIHLYILTRCVNVSSYGKAYWTE